MAPMSALMACLLVLDTSTSRGLVAYVDASGRVYSREVEAGAATSHTLFRAIESVLAEAGATVEALAGVAFGAGPGAFSGVRTAVAVAQGIGEARGLPVFAISALDFLAHCHPATDGEYLVSVIDARMGECYVGTYRAQDGAWAPVGAPAVLAPAAVVAHVRSLAEVPWSVVGQPELLELPLALRGQCIPIRMTAERFASFAAAHALRATAALDPCNAQPEYVRNKVALTTLERAVAQRERG